ncbi:MAG: primosomal protein N' [Deltaproteobacteria bacterium]|nr:primosomal protein N' [Deltaproteobacteria bacterium]
MPFANIAPLAPINSTLTYQIPDALLASLKIGQRLLIPLGKRKIVGIYLGEESSKLPQTFEVKNIEGILDEEPYFTAKQVQFLHWAAEYYLCPLGEMFKTAMPGELAKVPREGKRKEKITLSRQGRRRNALQLSSNQQKIVEEIQKYPGFQTHLLHGVTGSGKTEIYLELIRQTLEQGRQALCLVPEIGLTPQLLERFQKIFGDEVQAYHSNLSNRQRLEIWQRAKDRQFSVLLGTRSSLFVPFPNLGLIVVDEEQDSSYKQEERVRYHARDLAIVRAKFENICVILGSATPSVETYYKANSKKYIYHELLERFGEAKLPELEFVDLKASNSPEVTLKFFHPDKAKEKNKYSKNKLLSPQLLKAIAERLKHKEQSLIFLNRRGFAHFLLCQDCAYSPRCPNCDITLTFHQKRKKLICHYCDFIQAAPDHCPQCKGLSWLPMGSGTEKIEEELNKLFPEAKISRMDRDSTSKKGSLEKILKDLAEGKIDILVGTQMIAKGHDYPQVTLVGILLADASLHHPDFRASEITFQTLSQVSGRAGRGTKAGKVLLQCFESEHYSLQYAAKHQTQEFYAQELEQRKELSYPPFSRLLVLRFQGNVQKKVEQSATRFAAYLNQQKESQHWNWSILGPAPCLLERLKNQYRWQILIKNCGAPSFQNEFLNQQGFFKKEILEAGVRLILDVDPLHVMG